MLVELLHKVAGMESREEQAYRPRPSSAGPERCIRQMVYQAKGQEPDKGLSDRTYHIFNDGNWHEELTKEWIAKTAYTIHSAQMKVSVSMQGLTISGSIDGVATDILGTDRLIEIKSMNHFTFERYWAAKEFPEDYFVQCAIYLRGLHTDNPALSEGLLICKNKNTSGFIEYHLLYHWEEDKLFILQCTRHTGESQPLTEEREHIVEKAFDKFVRANVYVREKRLPDRPYEPDHWRCQYCQFQETCWSTYVDEVQTLADDVEFDPEMADTLRYYKELGAQITEQKKEQDGIKQTIKAQLKQRGAKQGKAGEYVATLAALIKNEIDWEGMPGTLTSEVRKYYKTSIQQRLTIKKLPAPKPKK